MLQFDRQSARAPIELCPNSAKDPTLLPPTALLRGHPAAETPSVHQVILRRALSRPAGPLLSTEADSDTAAGVQLPARLSDFRWVCLARTAQNPGTHAG